MPEDSVEDKKSKKERFIILLSAYSMMIREGYDDPKACVILGTIQPLLPEFLRWLKVQKSFTKIKDMPLEEFVDGMMDLAPLGESALKKLELKLRTQQAADGK